MLANALRSDLELNEQSHREFRVTRLGRSVFRSVSRVRGFAVSMIVVDTDVGLRRGDRHLLSRRGRWVSNVAGDAFTFVCATEGFCVIPSFVRG